MALPILTGQSVPVAESDQWAVLHCFAGYETAVIERIKRRVPDADVKQLRLEGTDIPGYLLWRWDPDAWEAVRNAGGVIGFDAGGGASRPALRPLSDLE